MKKKYVIGVGIAAIVVIGSVMGIGKFGNNKAVEMETYSLKQNSNDESIYATGTVVSKEKLSMYLSAPVVVGKISVTKGEIIPKGAVLGYINSDSMNVVYRELNIAKEEARMALENLQGASAEEIKLQEERVALAESKLRLIEEEWQAIDKETGAVTAPFAGVITEIGYVSGQTVEADQPLFVIEDITPEISVKLEEEYINAVKVENKANITGEYFDSVIEGTVKKVGNYIEEAYVDNLSTDVFEVSIDPNEGEGLMIGSTVEVEILRQKDENVLIIPAEALQLDASGKTYVWGIKENRAVQKSVEVISYGETNVNIKGDLDDIEEIMVSTSETLVDGETIK